MPSWNTLLNELESVNPQQRGSWFNQKQQEWLNKLSEKRGGRNVIFYASAFLQKPAAPPMALQITHEDINGLMAAMVGTKWERNLTLILHTPGGITNATESIVEYLTSKFTDIEVIVPTFAMSAGTMISLAANKIVMGRQSQLGPIDPQMPFNGRTVSARAIEDQFSVAKTEILGDGRVAAVWAPVLHSLGPSLLVEAKNALDYGERMVARWLKARMLSADHPKAARVANYFNKSEDHKSHGRRISREEAAAQGLNIEELEKDHELQDIVLTNYHLMTLLFEKSPAAKAIVTNDGKQWVKNLAQAPAKPAGGA